MKDYHITPYQFTTLHILSHLKLATELQEMLSKTEPLMVQDIMGKSALNTCVSSMAHECCESFLKNFYENESNQVKQMAYIANDIMKLLDFPSAFINHVIAQTLIQSDGVIPKTMKLAKSPTIQFTNT